MEVDNQGVKETFIHTGRRGGDRQPGQRGHVARWLLEYQGEEVAGGPTFTWEEQLGSKTMEPGVPAQAKKALKPLWL